MSAPIIFAIKERLPGRLGRAGELTTAHGVIKTPAFVTVGTKATVKALTPEAVKAVGAQVVLANTYHLYLQPGEDIVKAAGGFPTFMNWDGPTMTDSGGFQVFSLGVAYGKDISKITKVTDPSLLIPERFDDSDAPRLAKVGQDGVSFKSHLDGSIHYITPEKSIQFQMSLKTDMVVVLDDFTDPKVGKKEAASSVERTIAWAVRSKDEFLRVCEKEKLATNDRPYILGVVQGGRFQDLRKYCAERLTKIGFDGFGFGGWAVNSDQTLPYDLFSYVRSLVPDKYPLYAMGAGTPEQICELAKRGYDLFDCAIPSRNGRHGLCYTTVGNIKITNAQYKDDPSPLDPNLKSPASDYPKFFLHHLFKIKDPLAGNLLTMHNLRYFNHILENKS